MNAVIETNNISKSFRDVRAVDGVNLQIHPGEIYGFLGLNGAGKTTTIRMILGMIKPTSGSVKVFGEPVGPNGKGPWHRVGHLVEHTSSYPELTVFENLEISRRLHHIQDKNVTLDIIERLGIAPYTRRKAGKLSTGNLQRLGLARALLHQPDLLILDEPVNGLDPAGVVEIRKLLTDLANQHGVTIFMSSHILTEVDRLATRIGIIHEGQLMQELDRKQLMSLQAERLEVGARDLAAAHRALAQAGYQAKIVDNHLHLTQPQAIASPERIATILVQAGVPPNRIAVVQVDLENHFLKLIGEKG